MINGVWSVKKCSSGCPSSCVHVLRFTCAADGTPGFGTAAAVAVVVVGWL